MTSLRMQNFREGSVRRLKERTLGPDSKEITQG